MANAQRPARSDAPLLDRILADQPPAFAVLHRPHALGADRLEVLVGDVSPVTRLADLPLPEAAAGQRQDLVAVVPYRQIQERGFTCKDDGEPILALRVDEQETTTLDAALRRLPDLPISLSDVAFDIDDDTYAATVRAVIADEIGQGEGSNFVIKRSFTATIDDYSPAHALSLFRRLLTSELGAYWTFVVHTGSRTFVGATPERHVSLLDDVATMNPISGTYRYPVSGPTVAGVLDFLSDRKEAEELYMVVDEELKMMAKVCDDGGRVVGPYLKEMARLAHTEYLIEGRSSLDVRDVLRETLFAPTVTGSPIENACRVLARHEPVGRRYYSGAVAVVGRDDAGRRTLDSAILIRTADIDADGRLDLGVGATLVRHSDPESEVEETRAKAAGLLAAAGIETGYQPQRSTAAAAASSGRLGNHPAIREALGRRNDRLARFWLEPPGTQAFVDPDLRGRRVLVVDNEDIFVGMLAHQLRGLGLDVTIELWTEVQFRPDFADPYDFVIVGPGPGDPLDTGDPRIAAVLRYTKWLLAGATPFVSVCLGHQALSARLGLELFRKDPPSQGERRDIEWFGRSERAGFYNTFAARSDSDRFAAPALGATIQASRDPATGEVYGMRGPGFASAQFHPESLLTENGPALVAEMLHWALSRERVGDSPADAPAEAPRAAGAAARAR